MTALTSQDLSTLLERLDDEPADALESDVLEFKSSKVNAKSIRESVVAFANAQGGTLVIGVADRSRSRNAAIEGIENLDPSDLQRSIYDGTDPHITVDVEELVELEKRLLVVRVPSSGQLHTTTDGIAKWHREDTSRQRVEIFDRVRLGASSRNP
jgi:ATP-dependent DNA helicase RecG